MQIGKQLKTILQKTNKPYQIIKGAIVSFIDNDAIKLCASLSYYTIFSLPPLIIVIIALCGVFLGKEAVQGELFYEIQSLVGAQVAFQIQEIIKNLKLSNNNGIAAFIGSLMLFFGASGVFSEIQSSMNTIWHITTKPKTGILHFFRRKLISISMIGSVSFLLVVCLVINTVLDIMTKHLELYLKDSTVIIIQIINTSVVFVVNTILFILIYKTLPDKRMKWKYIFVAAFSTSFLFMIGKYLIGLYLGNSKIISVYGAAGTLIVLLVWVYYSAVILYFGAELAKSYARSNNEFDEHTLGG